jgi:hypothetical protein
MGQGTMTLEEAAGVSKMSVEAMAREAFEGRLALHGLPSCSECHVPDDAPCEPTCSKAKTQIVWVGDWYEWQASRG